jgi:hypothetical protein
VVVLPEPVGPGDEHHPVGAVDHVHQLALHPLVHPERVEAELGGGLVEQAEDDALAVDGRDDREADVDLLGPDADGRLPVLGAVPVGDVQLGHDLEARR